MRDKPPSYRQVMVGRFPTGLSGLDEVFAWFYEQGRAPAEELGAELVSRARQHNHIPHSSEAEFATVLLREYHVYYEQRQSGQEPPCNCETWQGIPRQQVPWFPILDEARCDGCDKCLQFCANGVYAKREGGTVYVAQPLRCVVGCDACARLCRHHAIVFPPRSMLSTLS